MFSSVTNRQRNFNKTFRFFRRDFNTTRFEISIYFTSLNLFRVDILKIENFFIFDIVRNQNQNQNQIVQKQTFSFVVQFQSTLKHDINDFDDDDLKKFQFSNISKIQNASIIFFRIKIDRRFRHKDFNRRMIINASIKKKQSRLTLVYFNEKIKISKKLLIDE